MSDSCVGEIRLFAFGYAPNGWLLCDGSTLPIQTNQALYTLIGITFGGNGTTNFNIPDLRGSTIIGVGRSPDSSTVYNLGNHGGAETITLAANNFPGHTHQVVADRTYADYGNASGNFFGQTVTSPTDTTSVTVYSNDAKATMTSLHGDTLSPAGSGTAINNMQPYLAMYYYIATIGYYPQRP